MLVCSSFGHSEFNLDGQVTKGPAEKALKIYAIEQTEGKLVIKV